MNSTDKTSPEPRTENPRAPLTILHVSDLHFGPPYLEEAGEALLRDAHRLDPRVIVASGDFTQRAKTSQYLAARAFLDKLPAVPLVTVPGNHDVPLYRAFERLLDPYRNYRRHISEELNHVVDVGAARFVALNTASPYTGVTNGLIRPSQLDFCEKAFVHHLPGGLRVVVAHHQFAPAPDFRRDAYMWGGKRALRRFETMEVDLILGGHVHRTFIADSRNVTHNSDRSHNVLIVQCGTTTSRRGRMGDLGRNTFNWIEVTPQTIQVTQHAFHEGAQQFLPAARHEYPRAPSHSLT